MTQLDHITAYTGIMPYFSNFADTDDPLGEMAIATEQFLKYVNDGFTPEFNTKLDKLNILSGEIEVAANSVSQNTQIVTDKTATVIEQAGLVNQAMLAAQNAQAAAEAVADGIDDRYLGWKTSDPVVDNDGNPLTMGALYYFVNPSDPLQNKMKVYDLELGQWLNQSYTPTSHSGLSGLSSDDHPQYLTEQRMKTAIEFKLNFYGGQ